MVEDKNAKLAREHYEKAEDYTKQAGQHTASAASTVGHDLRAAGEQIAEASKYIGSRCSLHTQPMPPCPASIAAQTFAPGCCLHWRCCRCGDRIGLCKWMEPVACRAG